jgi:hypothetical protein
MAKKTPKRPTMETVNVCAAAVDIGSRMHMAAVRPEYLVISFGCFRHLF